MGGGTGVERANAAAVQAAAHTVDASAEGAQRDHRDKWKQTLDSLPENMRAALALAVGAAQHGVRNHAMANMAIAANVLAGRLARHSLQAVKDADISALRAERSAIALSEAQIAQLQVMLAMHG